MMVPSFAPERRCSYRSMAAKDAASGRGPYAVCAPSRTGCVTEGAAFRPVDPSGHSAEGASSAWRTTPCRRRCTTPLRGTFVVPLKIEMTPDVPRALSTFLSSRVRAEPRSREAAFGSWNANRRNRPSSRARCGATRCFADPGSLSIRRPLRRLLRAHRLRTIPGLRSGISCRSAPGMTLGRGPPYAFTAVSSASARSVFSHEKPPSASGSRPKCP